MKATHVTTWRHKMTPVEEQETLEHVNKISSVPWSMTRLRQYITTEKNKYMPLLSVSDFIG